MSKPAAMAYWSPAQQRAYQQGFSLALLMLSEAGLLNKPAPPLSIRHDPALLHAFEQGYQVGLQQPKQRRYQGMMPWTKMRQLLFFLMVILAGLLVVIIMAPNDESTAESTAEPTQVDNTQQTTRPSEFFVPTELDDFALLTHQERQILLNLQAGLPNSTYSNVDSVDKTALSFDLLLDQHGLLDNEACRALFIWPVIWQDNISLIWIFDDKNQYRQNSWHEAFFPPTIGDGQVLILKDNLPIAHQFFYYGGHSLELLE